MTSPMSVAETVAICEAHEQLLVFSQFSSETAWQIGSIIRKRFLADSSLNADRDIVIQIKLFSGVRLPLFYPSLCSFVSL